MALEYTDAINGDGLFDILGKAFKAFEDLGTVRATTVRQQVLDFVNQYKTKADTTLDFDRAVRAAARGEETWRRAGDQLAGALRADAAGLLLEFVRADAELPRMTLTEALEYLIDQMFNDAVHVTPHSISSGSQTGSVENSSTDLTLHIGMIQHDAKSQETVIPETLEFLALSGGDAGTLRVRGERPARNKLAEDWPLGSGAEIRTSPLTADDSLLANAGFDDESTADIPDNWIVHVGTPGTTVRLTNWEQQQITITGTPSTGTYQLNFTDPVTSVVRSTTAIDFDATGSAVQSALRSIPGLENITVSSTGTSPNFVHTVEFVGQGGSLDLLTVTNNTDGSIAVSETVPGSDLPISGKGLEMVVHASELSAVYQPVTLDPDRVYFMGYWVTPSSAPASGVLEVGLAQSVGGSTLTDREGSPIRDSLDLTTITAKTARGFFFAMPPSASQPVHATVRKTTAESSANIVVDNVVISPARELYAGGPWVAAQAGKIPMDKDDLWTMAVNNDLAGKFQRYFDQFFDMAGKRLRLPTSGLTELTNSLIS